MSNTRRRVYPGDNPSQGQPEPGAVPQQVELFNGGSAQQQGGYSQAPQGHMTQQLGNTQYGNPQQDGQAQFHGNVHNTNPPSPHISGYNPSQFQSQPTQPMHTMQPTQPMHLQPGQQPARSFTPPPPPTGLYSSTGVLSSSTGVLSSSTGVLSSSTGSDPHGAHGRRRVYPVDEEGNYEAGGVDNVGSAMSNMNIGGQPQSPAMGARNFSQSGQLQPTGQFQPGGQGQGQYAQGQGQYAQGQGQYAQGGQPGHGSVAEYQAAPTAANQCPPCFMRMTINAFPATQSILTKSSIPLGCVIHPLRQTIKEEERVPVVSFGSATIVRCRRCRTYINPFVTFIDGGRRWRCNICDGITEVPSEYFSHIDPMTGLRQDIAERPELQRGCVEFMAPSEYMVRAPQPPVYFFMIDVCYSAVSSGMLRTVIQSIKSTLDSLPGDSRTQIGFITYDRSIHFYNLRSGLTQPQMMVVPDIENLFVPLCDDLLVSLRESRPLVDALLDQLPTMFMNTQQVESAFGSALKSAFNVIKHIGGKLLVFQSSLPLLGIGKLENREDPKILGTEKEVVLYNPSETASAFYKDYALDCSRQQIAIDLFLSPTAFVDVATLGVMPQITGGELFYYPAFKAEKHEVQVISDIQKVLSRYTSWEGVMRIRCSKGMKIAAHHGNFFIRSTDLLAIPNADEDKAFAFQITVTENLTGTKYGAIQSAVLYTNSIGERRIRVQTLSVPVVNTVPDLFRYADCGAITNLIAKMAIDKIQSTKLSDAREAIVNKCVDILAVYRDTFSSPGAGGSPAPAANQAGQLLIPENLRLLPLYVLALAKSPLFRPIDVRPDERVYHLQRFKTLAVEQSLYFIYPSLFEVTALTDDVANVLPQVLNLSSEKLDRRSVFLLDNMLVTLIYVPKQVAPGALYDLFGVEQFAQLESGPIHLPLLNTELSHNLHRLIEHLYRRAGKRLRVDIVKEGDSSEAMFLIQLVEDRNRAITSYYEFMVQLQRSVAQKAKS